MSNQYIIKFSNNTYNESVDGYAELLNTTYDIPILSIRSHENKTDPTNKTLLYQYITNSFGEYNFNDDALEFTLTFSELTNKIMFDKNSSSAYTEFKNQLVNLVNTKFETVYYPSGRVHYVGEVLYMKLHDGLQKVPHVKGIMYYDLPNYKVKYSGEFENGLFDGAGMFYNKNGNISLQANIANGIPTRKGKLEVNFRTNKQVFEIDFFDIWDDLECFDNKSKVAYVKTDNFLDDLAFNVGEFDGMTYEQYEFNSKTADEKIDEIWNLLKTVQQENHTEYSRLTSLARIDHVYSCIFNFLFVIMLSVLIYKK